MNSFLNLKVLLIRFCGFNVKKKGIFEVQVRGAVEGEEIIEAIEEEEEEEEEPFKLNSDLHE